MNKQDILELTKDQADDFYLSAFQRIASGKRVIWNWGAFFGSFMWMFYRKMYLRSFLYFIPLAFFHWLSACLALWEMTDIRFITMSLGAWVLSWIVWTLLSLWCGLFGTKMYYKHIRTKIHRGDRRKRNTTGDVLNVVLLFYFSIIHACLMQGISMYNSCRGITLYGGESLPHLTKKISAAFVVYGAGFALGMLIIATIGVMERIRRKSSSPKRSKKPLNTDTTTHNILPLISTKSEEYYLKKFRQIEKGKVISTNLAALVGGWMWFMRKKMYKPAAVIAAVPTLSDLLLLILPPNGAIFMVGVMVRVVMNFLISATLFLGGANHFYYRSIMKKSAEKIGSKTLKKRRNA
jgi:hypothetical protein